MVEKIKIKLEDLTKDSTPCEICVAMNGREVEKNDKGNYYEKMAGSETPCSRVTLTGGSSCTDVHKAQMRIEFLNYFEYTEIDSKLLR